MNKERYRLGVVFKSEIMDSVPGFEDVKEDIQLLPTIRQVVQFLTTDIRNAEEAENRIEDIDDLIYDLNEIRAISNHLYENEDSRLKLVQIFISLCRMFIDLFLDVDFYRYCRSNLVGRPTVIQGANKNHFVIFVRRPFPIRQ